MSATDITSVKSSNDFFQKHPYAIFFFGSSSCGHCTTAKQFFPRLIQENPQIGFGYVEVTKVKVENLKGVPVFVAYLNGQPVDMVLGPNERGIKNMISANFQINTDQDSTDQEIGQMVKNLFTNREPLGANY